CDRSCRRAGQAFFANPCVCCDTHTDPSRSASVWGKRAWRWHASWESDYGSCCGTRLTTKSSVVADRSRKVVLPRTPGVCPIEKKKDAKIQKRRRKPLDTGRPL